MTAKRSALYIRVSHEEQAMNGYSLQAQENRLRQYALEHNYQIVECYRDEGISARSRPVAVKSLPECYKMFRPVESTVSYLLSWIDGFVMFPIFTLIRLFWINIMLSGKQRRKITIQIRLKVVSTLTLSYPLLKMNRTLLRSESISYLPIKLNEVKLSPANCL